MKLLDLFYFFLGGDKSSRQIIEEKQHTKPVQHKTVEASDNGVEDFDDFENEMFEELD